jgi:hypothetical protein
LLCQYGFAQDDSIKGYRICRHHSPGSKNDTIRIGNILIIKKGKKLREEEGDNVTVTNGTHYEIEKNPPKSVPTGHI